MSPSWIRGTTDVNARKFLKILHTLGGFGMTGGIIAYMFMAQYGVEPEVSEEFVKNRAAIETVSSWVIMPSMIVVLASGLLAMAVHYPFQNMLWVWLKALSGLLIFEATLASVDGPAGRAVAAARTALEDQHTAAWLENAVRDHWGALWALLVLSALNVILGIWRPRFHRPVQRD